MLVILFSSDLMLMSSTSGAAASSGLRFCSVSKLADIAQRLQDGPTMVCLDLSAADGDPVSIAQSIPPDMLLRSIAFGPHVHTGKLDQARQAGFGKVMSRGQFVAKMSELLAAAKSECQ